MRGFLQVCISVLGVASLATLAWADSPFPASFELLQIGPGDGVVLRGESPDDRSGRSFANIGDFNGDGIDDFAVGAPEIFFPEGPGKVHVVFGTTGGFPATIELGALDGTDGFTIPGIDAGGVAGFDMDGAGDVNGDGLADLIFGAPFASFDGQLRAGKTYVVFGADGPYAATFDLSTLDGSNGFFLGGEDSFDDTGSAVAGAGDVNGDGFDDVLIGSSRVGSFSGIAYVYFGGPSLPASEDLSNLDGTNGFAIPGLGPELLGLSVAGAGDVNADGFADILVSEPEADPMEEGGVGQCHCIFGTDSGFGPTFDFTSLDGTNGFTVIGAVGFQGLGENDVNGGGDFNGDGIDDLLISARAAGDPFDAPGKVFAIFGSVSPFPAIIEAATLDGSAGFTLIGKENQDFFGQKADVLGDVNGDGVDDILVGASGVDRDGASSIGEAYVFFGSRDPFPASVEASSLDGTRGFVMFGSDPGDSLGINVSAAGDVNRDGLGDFLVASTRGISAGESYLVFGRRPCQVGQVNAGNGFRLDSLFVNGSPGDTDRRLEITAGASLEVTLLKPIAGGNGKFALHANLGQAEATDRWVLPFGLGVTCHPFLTSDGAAPVIVANNLGRTGLIGESQAFGVPQTDPDRATTILTYPPVPVGTVLTFQGVIVDPGSSGGRAVSATNAVEVTVVP